MKSSKRLKQQSDYAMRTYHGRPSAQRILLNMRHRAKKKGVPFDLEVEDIVVPVVCPVLGVPMAFSHPNKDYRPSIDRWDNSLGYIKTNIRIISCRANRIKTDATAAELFAVAAYAAGQ